MSYLHLAKGIPNFSKAVISLWFRVPKASIEAARAEEYPPESSEIFKNMIPLFVFGRQQENIGHGSQSGNIASGDAKIFDTVGFGPTNYPQYWLEPCFIALNCGFSLGFDPNLIFNIRMSNSATGTNLYTGAASVASIPALGLSNEETELWRQKQNTPGSGVAFTSQYTNGPPPALAVGYWLQYSSIRDWTSDYLSAEPEVFYVETIKRIAPDVWHHLLLSFDVSTAVEVRAPPPNNVPDNDGIIQPVYWNNIAMGVSSHARLWYAIDDVDYRGRASAKEIEEELGGNSKQNFLHRLGPYSVDYGQQVVFIPGVSTPGQPSMDDAPEMGNPNGILTERGFDAGIQGSGPENNLFVAADTYNYTPEPIPAKDGEMGFPASAKYVEHIHRVELAEFQMWTGVTLDTGIEKNRRAFIDYQKNEAGNPITPPTMVPVDPSAGATKDDDRGLAEKLLGKRQDVMLHGADNWTTGYNTGSTGVTQELVEIADGQFRPVAKIVPYTPDPIFEKKPVIPPS